MRSEARPTRFRRLTCGGWPGTGIRGATTSRRHREQGLWGLVDTRHAPAARPAGNVDPRVVAAAAAVIDAQAGTSTRTRGRVIRQVIDRLEAEHGPGVVPVPSRATFYRLLAVLSAGRFILRAFCADALSSTVNLNAGLDVVLAVLAQALTAALRTRLPGYATITPDTIQRRFLETPGQIITDGEAVTIRLDRRAFSPVLRSADLPPATPVPWWGYRPIRYEFA